METVFQNFWTSNRLTFKGITVGFLILVMMIPAIFISILVAERKTRQAEVIKEVSSKWASAQTISGPFLAIPYKQQVTTNEGKQITEKRWATFLPEQLKISGILKPETRHRSIFNVIVYQSDILINGSFAPLALGNINLNKEDLYLDEAYLCMGLSDFRGIENALNVKWNDSSYAFNAGMPDNKQELQGLSVPVKLNLADLDQTHTYSLEIKLKGSEQLYFTPIGKTTDVELRSSSINPAFDGNFLPDTHQISDKGFTANWKILHLNRPFPQEWKDRDYDMNKSAFGVTLLQGGDSYSKTERSVKYSLLFVTLTFLLYFFIEILQKKKVHPLQYVLVGLAIIIFYTLLLSISEYLGFDTGYLIAASATVLLITAYTKSIFTDWKIVAIFFLVLSALYGFIFVLIQLKDGALLFGSIGLFTILAIVMYYSRKVEWFNRPVATSVIPEGK
jgi:inner membrane protein